MWPDVLPGHYWFRLILYFECLVLALTKKQEKGWLYLVLIATLLNYLVPVLP